MTTTEMDIEAQIPWAKEIAAMDVLKDAAIARGVDPDLARYLAQSAALQKHVMAHNAKAAGLEPLHYASMEEFVLVHGQPFAAPDKARPKGQRKGRNRLCFMNATNAVLDHNLEDEAWHYVEGFGQASIPCHHAWALDAEGTVVETTWKEAGSAYVGVAFPEKIWREAIYLKGTYGVLCETLLEEAYDPEHPEAFVERLKAKKKADR